MLVNIAHSRDESTGGDQMWAAVAGRSGFLVGRIWVMMGVLGEVSLGLRRGGGDEGVEAE